MEKLVKYYLKHIFKTDKPISTFKDTRQLYQLNQSNFTQRLNLISILGSGVQGVTVLMTDIITGIEVVVKFCPLILESDVNEYNISKYLDIYNFSPKYYSSFEIIIKRTKFRLYIMEYIKGSPITDQLVTKISLKDKLNISVQCLKICKSFFEAGLIHGDFFPNNIIWNPMQKKVYAIDLGMTKPILKTEDSFLDLITIENWMSSLNFPIQNLKNMLEIIYQCKTISNVITKLDHFIRLIEKKMIDTAI